eukprot:scaffold279680_cov15-Tisochrysis_lutea.AAC.1
MSSCVLLVYSFIPVLTSVMVACSAALQKALDNSNEQLRALRLRYDGMVQERDLALGVAQEAQKSEAEVQAELIRIKVSKKENTSGRKLSFFMSRKKAELIQIKGSNGKSKQEGRREAWVSCLCTCEEMLIQQGEHSK